MGSARGPVWLCQAAAAAAAAQMELQQMMSLLPLLQGLNGKPADLQNTFHVALGARLCRLMPVVADVPVALRALFRCLAFQC